MKLATGLAPSQTKKRFVAPILLCLCSSGFSTNIPNLSPQKPYIRYEVVQARYGEGERRAALARIPTFSADAKATLVGQDKTIDAIATRLTEYLGSFGAERRDPVGINLVGLFGLGKSVLLQKMANLGIPALYIDLQLLLATNQTLGDYLLRVATERTLQEPLLLGLDELDKISALKSDKVMAQAAASLLAEIAQIITDGQLQTDRGGLLRLNNAFVVTAMNLSLDLVAEWQSGRPSNKQARTAGPLSFWDLSADELADFHTWVTNEGGRQKALAHTFDARLVGRISTNSVFMPPLTQQSYDALIELLLQQQFHTLNTEGVVDRRLELTFSSAFVNHLKQTCVFPPSGARESVFRINAMSRQLFAFAQYAVDENKTPPDRPRRAFIDFDADAGEVVLRITPILQSGKRTKAGTSFDIRTKFDFTTNAFSLPHSLEYRPPQLTPPVNQTKMADLAFIRSWRFPTPYGERVKTIETAINEELFGHETGLAPVIAQHFAAYLNNPIYNTQRDPRQHSHVYMGISGIGKTEAILAATRAAELPIVQIKLQKYAQDAQSFAADLSKQVSIARATSPDGKFVVLLEELDKLHEIDPGTGYPLTPVSETVGMVKELLENKSVVVADHLTGSSRVISVENVLLLLTMNFSGNLFSFQPDPRITTFRNIETVFSDVLNREVPLRHILGRIFLPDTINRMAGRIHVVRPPDLTAHRNILVAARNSVCESRLGGPGYTPQDNYTWIILALSPSYLEYLEREAIVPSEGGRRTFQTATKLITRDLDAALSMIRRSRPEGHSPLKIVLQFRKNTNQVFSTLRTLSKLEGGADGAIRLLHKQTVEVQFPPLSTTGKLDALRINVSVHEFGHALLAVMHGGRFESIVVESLSANVAGFVKAESPTVLSGKGLVARLVGAMGARVMERILLSGDGQAASPSASGVAGVADMQTATALLEAYLFELGLSEHGGAGSRSGSRASFEANPHSLVQFGNLSPEEGRALQFVLRDLEEYLVKLVQENFKVSWLVEKVEYLARAGVLDEEAFYELIERAYPGAGGKIDCADFPGLEIHFGACIRQAQLRPPKHRVVPLGNHTVDEYINLAHQTLEKSILKHFGLIFATSGESQMSRLCSKLLTSKKHE